MGSHQREEPLRVGRKGKVLAREWFITELREQWHKKERGAIEVVHAWYLGIHAKAKYELAQVGYAKLAAPIKHFVQYVIAVQSLEIAAMREAREETRRYNAAVLAARQEAARLANFEEMQ